MQHVHVSTEFMASVLLFGAMILTILLVFVVAMRKARTERILAERMQATGNPYVGAARPSAGFSGASQPSQQAAPYPPGAQYAGPTVIHSDGGMPMGLVTGMLIGGAMIHHDHTTVVHDYAPAPAPAPAQDSGGFTWDSGGGSCDSGSSFGGDSGGGGFGGC